MRLCRFEYHGRVRCGFYQEDFVVPLDDLATLAGEKTLAESTLGGHLELLLPIDSPAWSACQRLASAELLSQGAAELRLPTDSVQLLPPIARPNKLLLLAGNYSKHVEEQGGQAAERERTFPYVFMKPPSTTLIGSGCTFTLPVDSATGSPAEKLDHEVELAVVIGRTVRHVDATEALDAVAGYTIVNDLSDRGFRPNPDRQTRPKDAFFDWQHGKWHDGSCPCGPCLVAASEIPDPNGLQLKLSVDGDLRQNGNTAEQTYSVAETISFLSQWVTLEPGDIISTGTPSGVGNASGKFLKSGQKLTCEIEDIGRLITYIG
ncbi:MAG TPA: 5-carboxymethyl-2-hydroxymuconate isomerase [Planctomycetaceae bacterium]|nr:5-carboxymethyl-2-hydroxymuconate isomerase [Planctomycetaceae bacterium]